MRTPRRPRARGGGPSSSPWLGLAAPLRARGARAREGRAPGRAGPPLGRGADPRARASRSPRPAAPWWRSLPVAKGERGPVYEAQGPAGHWTLGTPEGLRPIGGHTMDMTPGMPAITLGRRSPAHDLPPAPRSRRDRARGGAHGDAGRSARARRRRREARPRRRRPHGPAAARRRPRARRSASTPCSRGARTRRRSRRGRRGTARRCSSTSSRRPRTPSPCGWVAAPGANAPVGETIRLVSTLGTLESVETAPLEGDSRRALRAGALRARDPPRGGRGRRPRRPRGGRRRRRGRGPRASPPTPSAASGSASAASTPPRVRPSSRCVPRARPPTASLRSEPCPAPRPSSCAGSACRPGAIASPCARATSRPPPPRRSRWAPWSPPTSSSSPSASATLSVSLEGGAPAGRRYDVEARRLEGDAEVLGQGFCSRNVAPSRPLALPAPGPLPRAPARERRRGADEGAVARHPRRARRR